jgi:hypothetical protein
VVSALAAVVLAVAAASVGQEGKATSSGGLMLTSRALVGQELRLADGRRAGAVAELVIGATSGRLELLVVEVDGLTVAVPWSKVSVGRDGALTLSTSRIELAQSPEIPLEALEKTASAQR